MKTVSLDEAQASLLALLIQAKDTRERVVVTRDGEPVAAVVPLEDLELLEELESTLDLSDARAARREVDEGGSVSWEDLKAELGI
jgi:prevent-host-death family protein